MAITLIAQPDKFMFSGNFIPIRFQCADYLQAEAVASINEITFLGSTVGKSINLAFGGLSVSMLASATPDDSGYQFPSGDGSAGYVATILQYFKDNYLLNEYYEITQSTTKLIFTARNKQSGLDFKAITDASFTVSNTTSGATEEIKENYSVYFELYLQNKTHTSFDKIYSAYLPLIYNSAGLASIDVHERLETSLLNDIYRDGVEAPIMSDISANPCLLSCRKYYFKYAESWAEQIKKVTVSSNYTVLLGAFSYPAQHLINQLVWFTPDADKTKDRFLWQGAKTISTRFDTPQFFYFYNNRTTVAGANLRVKFYFTDATTATKTVSTFALNADEKYSFNLRFDVLHYNLIAPDGAISAKKVDHYEVWLDSPGSKISETLTFTVDRTYQQQVRYFAYLSSLGTFDTLTAIGEGKNSFDIEQQESEILRRANGKTADGDAMIYDVTLRHKFAVACGWEKTKEDFIRKRDFFASAKKYRYVNGYFLPIKITSKTIDESQDGRGLDAHVLEYEYLFNEKAFTQFDADEPIANNFDL